MIKGKYIESIQRELAGGDLTADFISKYDPRIIESAIDPFYEAILHEIYQGQKNKKDFGVFDNFTKNYEDREILKDAKGKSYTLLPCSLVGIPPEVAIRSVSPNTDVSVTFQVVSKSDISTYTKSIGAKMRTKTLVYPVYDRIYYYNFEPSALKYVSMDIVVPFSQFAFTDDITIPKSLRGTIKELILNELRGVQYTPEDQNLDNRANIRYQYNNEQ